jgi:hypothetical protein
MVIAGMTARAAGHRIEDARKGVPKEGRRADQKVARMVTGAMATTADVRMVALAEAETVDRIAVLLATATANVMTTAAAARMMRHSSPLAERQERHAHSFVWA